MRVLCYAIAFLSASYELAYIDKQGKAPADFIVPALIHLLLQA